MRQFRVVTGKRDIVLRPGVFIIGRGRTADLMLGSPSVSRKHAMLRISLDELTVEDIGSRNGVRVNGVRIEGPTDLRNGDMIEVGDERIDVVEGAVPSSRFARTSGPPTSEFEPLSDEELEGIGLDERTVRVPPVDTDADVAEETMERRTMRVGPMPEVEPEFSDELGPDENTVRVNPMSIEDIERSVADTDAGADAPAGDDDDEAD